MDNETLNNIPESASDDVTEAADKVADEAAEISQTVEPVSAFDYQPPEVEVPEPPTTDDLTAKTEVSSAETTAEKTVEQSVTGESAVSQPAAGEPAVSQPASDQSSQQTGIPPYTQQYYQYTPVNPALVSRQNTSDGFAVASLICALVGLVSCCTVLPSFLALVFGAISKAKNDGTRPTGMSTAGLVLGIIGIIINLLILMFMFYVGE